MTTPAWQETKPFNRSPALGHVDWVGETGYPMRATLHEDGRWTCTIARLAGLLDAFQRPEDSAESIFGLDCLRDYAEKVGGEVVLVSTELAIRKHPQSTRLAGREVVDG